MDQDHNMELKRILRALLDEGFTARDLREALYAIADNQSPEAQRRLARCLYRAQNGKIAEGDIDVDNDALISRADDGY
jgi:hypothetical protein